MGIFTSREIAAGEELSYDYNFDTLGFNQQTCHCGEPNCRRFITSKSAHRKQAELDGTASAPAASGKRGRKRRRKQAAAAAAAAPPKMVRERNEREREREREGLKPPPSTPPPPSPFSQAMC